MAFPSIENTAKNIVGTVQDYSLFAWRGATNLFRPPIYWPDFLVQSDIIGFGSASIVLLSGFFTGGVLALQSAATLSQFGATAVTGGMRALVIGATPLKARAGEIEIAKCGTVLREGEKSSANIVQIAG